MKTQNTENETVLNTLDENHRNTTNSSIFYKDKNFNSLVFEK